MALIVLMLLAGLGWWLFSARESRAQEAKAFVREVAARLAFDLDRKVLDVRLNREAQVRYPPSFRDRLIDRLRGFGRPTGDIEVKGDVVFTSYFFEPSGLLRAALTYPQMRVYLDLTVSQRHMRWQIDTINLSWEPIADAPQPAVPVPPPGP